MDGVDEAKGLATQRPPGRRDGHAPRRGVGAEIETISQRSASAPVSPGAARSPGATRSGATRSDAGPSQHQATS